VVVPAPNVAEQAAVAPEQIVLADTVATGNGFTVPLTANRVADTQPVVVFRACA
jgi:hypothetical protein